MSRSYGSQKQKVLKRKLIQRKLELGTFSPERNPLHDTIEELSDPLVRKLSNEFWSGNLRYGNKRKYEAYMKKHARKVERKKLNKLENYE